MAAFLGCAEALQGVRDLLVGRPTNVNVKAAVATLDAILAQRGCEDNSVWADGYGDRDHAAKLTSVMDCVIFG